MNAAADLIEVRVPDMGNFKDVAIIDVLVKAGESIEPESPLVTLETEKATMDVPSTVGGVIEKVHVAKGGTVSTGDLVATVRSESAPKTAASGSDSSARAGNRTEPAAEKSADRQPAAAPAASPAKGAGPRGKGAPPAEKDTRSTSGSTSEGAGKAAKAPDSQRQGPQPSTQAVSRTPAPTGERQAAQAARPPINEPGFSQAHASPSVRRFARELGVDLTKVAGGGFKGRVTHDDVKAFVKRSLSGAEPAGAGAAGAARGGLPAIPSVDFAQFGAVETQPLSRIQRISGPRLHASWVNIPHVTQFDEADITELEELRGRLRERANQQGIKLTPLAFILRACVRTLQEFPVVNASLDASGANLVLKKYIHLGFAADTPHGLVVPVVRDADHKDIYEIARALGELSEKARAGKLTPVEMQGGSFTISSLGGIGGTAFTPIINAPEVAILGVSRSAMRAVYQDEKFIPRLMLPLSLSYDHRVVDGALAARFTTFLAKTLANPRELTEAVP